MKLLAECQRTESCVNREHIIFKVSEFFGEENLPPELRHEGRANGEFTLRLPVGFRGRFHPGNTYELEVTEYLYDAKGDRKKSSV